MIRACLLQAFSGLRIVMSSIMRRAQQAHCLVGHGNATVLNEVTNSLVFKTGRNEPLQNRSIAPSRAIRLT
jgi:hypothetical protein